MRQWNQNYAIGGTGCLIRTLEGNTGAVHRPLRRRRLPRLQADGRRARRCRGLHPGGHRRRAHPPAAHARHAHPRRAPGAAVRAGAQVDRRRVRPAAHRPPAGVPVLGDAEGDLDPAAARARPSSTASSTPRRGRSRPTPTSGSARCATSRRASRASAWTRSSSSPCPTSRTPPTRTGCSGRRPRSRSGRHCAPTAPVGAEAEARGHAVTHRRTPHRLPRRRRGCTVVNAAGVAGPGPTGRPGARGAGLRRRHDGHRPPPPPSPSSSSTPASTSRGRPHRRGGLPRRRRGEDDRPGRHGAGDPGPRRARGRRGAEPARQRRRCPHRASRRDPNPTESIQTRKADSDICS